MAIIQLLSNGILAADDPGSQPIAYGAALGIHPLAVLIVTIGGGCLFGAAGLILVAAPVASAIVRESPRTYARPGVPKGSRVLPSRPGLDASRSAAERPAQRVQNAAVEAGAGTTSAVSIHQEP